MFAADWYLSEKCDFLKSSLMQLPACASHTAGAPIQHLHTLQVDTKGCKFISFY